MRKVQKGAGRRAVAALTMGMAIGLADGGTANGQSAYFSLQGKFDAATDRHDFNFDLTRAVQSGEDLRLLTLANDGGTNAAGQTVASGGIDSVLRLTNPGLSVDIIDDDGGSGFDSLIDPAATLPADSYRLNMSNLTNTAGLPWALDVVAPADAIVFTSAGPDTTSGPGTSTTDSLSFGTTPGSGPGSAAATFNQTGTLNILEDLVIAQTGNAVFSSPGTTNVTGTTFVNFGGTLDANGVIGSFNANGGVVVDGGTLNAVANRFQLGANHTLEIINGGVVNHEGGTSITNGKSYNVTGGSLNVIDFLDVFNATLELSDGSDLTINHAENDLSLWGINTSFAAVTFRTQATGNIDEILSLGTGSTLNVQSGAQLTLENFQVGGGTGPGTAVVDLRGFEPDVSKITQTGNSTLTIGGETVGNGTVNISDEAEYTTGTGVTTINPGGVLDIREAAIFTANGDLQINGGAVHHNYDPTANGGAGASLGADGAKLNANGNVNVTGGQLNAIGADFELGADKTLTASNDAVVRFDGDYFLEGGNTFNINSGADFTVGVFMDIGTDSDAGGDGTLVADGAGSTVTIDPNGNAVTTWGGSGATGSVTARNQAVVTVGSSDLVLGESFGGPSVPAATGILTVESGAVVNVNNLELAGGTLGIAEVTVDGSSSRITQSAASSTLVGGTGSLATNRATLTIENGALFEAGDGVDGFQVHPNGTLRVRNNGQLVTGADVKNNGRVAGSGVIDAPVLDNFGTVTTAGQITGMSTGVSNLRVTGDYIHRSTATLEISRVPGFALTELDVNGAADLFGGTLDFVSADVAGEFQTLAMYDPTRILSSSLRSGQFATITGHILGDDTAFAVTYGLIDGDVPDSIFARRALYGDANLDGFISQADLDAVLLNWGKTTAVDGISWMTGDFSGDGFVSQADLDAVLLNWGNGTPPPPGTVNVNAVPEPTSLALLAGAALLAGRRRRGVC